MFCEPGRGGGGELSKIEEGKRKEHGAELLDRWKGTRSVVGNQTCNLLWSSGTSELLSFLSYLLPQARSLISISFPLVISSISPLYTFSSVSLSLSVLRSLLFSPSLSLCLSPFLSRPGLQPIFFHFYFYFGGGLGLGSGVRHLSL